MRWIDTFERQDGYLAVFDEQTDLGNNFAMHMAAEGSPWGWTSVVYHEGEANEHLGRQLGNYDLYHVLGEKTLGLFLDRLSINWPVSNE